MAIDASAVARVVGIDAAYKDLRGGAITYLPQRIAVLAQGSADPYATYSLDKFTATSAKEVGDRFGYGSPAHLIARELFPENGDGVGTIPVTFYPLDDDYDSGGTQAVGTITPSGTQTKAAAYKVRASGYLSDPFVVAASATVAARCASIAAAINAKLHFPVIAVNRGTRVDMYSKWTGESANDIQVTVEGDALGTTFTVVNPTGGASNPTLTTALNKMGNIWETLVINALNPADEDALDEIQTFGEGRWVNTVKKPLLAFYGSNTVSRATVTTIPATRTDDRINCIIPQPGSPNLPCVIAARAVARIAKMANNNPAHDYDALQLTGLIPGDDDEQWLYADRDLAVKAGASTTEIVDGVVQLSDVVTHYAPDGEPTPAYRWVRDVVVLQNIIFNMNLIFASSEWAGAPLIPDEDPTSNPTAKKPKMAKAALNAMIDSLARAAMLSAPEAAKKLTTASINSQNPKRLDASITVQISGTTKIKGLLLEFGFYFGQDAIVG